MRKIQRLTSLEARVMTDYASGLRGDGPEFLVTTRDGRGRSKVRPVKEHDPCSGEHEVVSPVDTPFVQPSRPPVTGVGMMAGAMQGMESLMQYDAVFWSEAAVEKFLFPYYASKYQWQAAHVLRVLTEKWYGYLPSPGVGPDSSNVASEDIPFAVGHLPRSDYVTLGEELALVYRDGEGNVTHRLLSEFM